MRERKERGRKKKRKSEIRRLGKSLKRRRVLTKGDRILIKNISNNKPFLKAGSFTRNQIV